MTRAQKDSAFISRLPAVFSPAEFRQLKEDFYSSGFRNVQTNPRTRQIRSTPSPYTGAGQVKRSGMIG